MFATVQNAGLMNAILHYKFLEIEDGDVGFIWPGFFSEFRLDLGESP